MKKEFLDQIETPCVVIDERVAIKNIKEWQKFCDDNSCQMRPHVKTHKMGYFAKLQESYGAVGITCCKVSEAEAMSEKGLEDIFIAYPMVGDFRIKRALELNKKVQRLILAVDSSASAKRLNEMALADNQILEVRLEVDTGAKRTGIPYDQAVDLALEINDMKGLNITGIYTFKHLVFNGEPTTDERLAGTEEGQMMAVLGKKLEEVGLKLHLSAGSSPTAKVLAEGKWVDEVRPGTYIFKDYMMVKENVAELKDFACHMYATVVSVPSDEYCVIDAGNKVVSKDIPVGVAPYFYPAHALIEDEDLELRVLFEEHGMVYSKSGKINLQVGDKIKLTPIHACTVVNLQNEVYIYNDDKIWKEKVDGRGMVV